MTWPRQYCWEEETVCAPPRERIDQMMPMTNPAMAIIVQSWAKTGLKMPKSHPNNIRSTLPPISL